MRESNILRGDVQKVTSPDVPLVVLANTFSTNVGEFIVQTRNARNGRPLASVVFRIKEIKGADLPLEPGQNVAGESSMSFVE